MLGNNKGQTWASQRVMTATWENTVLARPQAMSWDRGPNCAIQLRRMQALSMVETYMPLKVAFGLQTRAYPVQTSRCGLFGRRFCQPQCAWSSQEGCDDWAEGPGCLEAVDMNRKVAPKTKASFVVCTAFIWLTAQQLWDVISWCPWCFFVKACTRCDCTMHRPMSLFCAKERRNEIQEEIARQSRAATNQADPEATRALFGLRAWDASIRGVLCCLVRALDAPCDDPFLWESHGR